MPSPGSLPRNSLAIKVFPWGSVALSGRREIGGLALGGFLDIAGLRAWWVAPATTWPVGFPARAACEFCPRTPASVGLAGAGIFFGLT